MALEAYREKRDFQKTTEPRGVGAVNAGLHRFVVQEHHASHLHFDFRLEVGGVLKSWAVPKGLPDRTGIRRLAIMTEDHPVEYLTFAGTIPEGNYGAGEMSIWDEGEYEWAGQGDLAAGIEAGKLELILNGHRLQGKFDMIRTDDDLNQWIVIRAKNLWPAPASATPSVAGDRQNGGRVELPLGSVPSTVPNLLTLTPMLADSVEIPFDGPEWSFEIKWDGYRAFLMVSNGNVELVSRNHQTLTANFRELAGMAQFVGAQEAILDGEIVALDRSGKPVFQQLQNHLGKNYRRSGKSSAAERAPGRIEPVVTQIVFMAFDIVYAEGNDLTAATLADRRNYLHSIILPGGPIRFSDDIVGEGVALFEQVRELGLEGIVAKRRSSVYVYRRSSDWKKIRVIQTVDVVIGGYTDSTAPGRLFGSLIVGQFGEDGLRFMGHVGTGFDASSMEALIDTMCPFATKICPFSEVPDVNGTPHWLTPEVVCEVKYSNITDDNRLRHPVFVRLRPDKDAIEKKADESRDTHQTEGKGMETNTVDGLLANAAGSASVIIEVDQHQVKLTHLEKVFWPKTGTSKGDLLRYYNRVSETLLPHLHDRPVVLERYPDGVGGGRFFQHDIGSSSNLHPGAGHTVPPSYIRTYDIVESSGLVHYALCDNVSGLLYLLNLGTIPLHCWNITVEKPHNPDRIVFDLDPGGDISTATDVALNLKEILQKLGLTSYAKTSGADGIHLYVPVKPDHSSDQIVLFSKLIAESARAIQPKLITLERRVKSRGAAQVYLDYGQNAVGKTVVAPYTVRAVEQPNVSTPLLWPEVVGTLKMSDYSINNVPDRIKSLGDLFLPVIESPQNLAPVFEKLGIK